MPKKSEFLPPPKPDSHPEEAAILTHIFKKEPLITYRDLLDKYKSEVSEKQALSGLLGLFTAYVDRPDDDPLFPQLMQAKQAALQMEILSRPIGGNLSMPETEIQILAKAALKSALVGLPAGLACYFTCYAVATRALSASGNALSEPLAERILLSSANQNALTQYSMQTDSIFRNLPKLLPEEENEVYVGKSAGKNVSTIVTMDFPKTLALDGGGSLTNFDKAILNGVSSLLIAGTIYFTIPMLYRAMIGSENPSMREEAVQTIRERLEFMRHSTITLDCTEEAAANFIKEGQNLQSLTFSQYLLPMNRMNAVLNGREVEAYFLIDTPPLFQYASNKRQISLVDMDLLNVHFAEDSPLAGASLNNTPRHHRAEELPADPHRGHEEPKQPSAKPKDPVHIHLRGARRAVAHQAAPPAPAQLHRDLSRVSDPAELHQRVQLHPHRARCGRGRDRAGPHHPQARANARADFAR